MNKQSRLVAVSASPVETAATERCEECGGSGEVCFAARHPDDPRADRFAECHCCGGSGQVLETFTPRGPRMSIEEAHDRIARVFRGRPNGVANLHRSPRNPERPAMTDRSELLKLAERCEAATGPDRELDRLIYAAKVGLSPLHIDLWQVAELTASLDAAMTLVPEGCDWSVEWHEGVAYAYVAGIDKNYWGRTPALALCAAALRAQSEQGQ